MLGVGGLGEQPEQASVLWRYVHHAEAAALELFEKDEDSPLAVVCGKSAGRGASFWPTSVATPVPAGRPGKLVHCELSVCVAIEATEHLGRGGDLVGGDHTVSVLIQKRQGMPETRCQSCGWTLVWLRKPETRSLLPDRSLPSIENRHGFGLPRARRPAAAPERSNEEEGGERNTQASNFVTRGFISCLSPNKFRRYFDGCRGRRVHRKAG